MWSALSSPLILIEEGKGFPFSPLVGIPPLSLNGLLIRFTVRERTEGGCQSDHDKE